MWLHSLVWAVRLSSIFYEQTMSPTSCFLFSFSLLTYSIYQSLRIHKPSSNRSTEAWYYGMLSLPLLQTCILYFYAELGILLTLMLETARLVGGLCDCLHLAYIACTLLRDRKVVV